jgi:hypothetical protein
MKRLSIILWFIIACSYIGLANNNWKERETMMNKVFT